MIEVELSNIWGSVSLPDLLSGEKDLFDAHMQLRTNVPDGPDFLGWLNAPEGVMARAMLAIGKAAEKIAELGDTLVVVGSGDAPLAAQAAGHHAVVAIEIEHFIHAGKPQLHIALHLRAQGPLRRCRGIVQQICQRRTKIAGIHGRRAIGIGFELKLHARLLHG